jgi:hypothetical protein
MLVSLLKKLLLYAVAAVVDVQTWLRQAGKTQVKFKMLCPQRNSG